MESLMQNVITFDGLCVINFNTTIYRRSITLLEVEYLSAFLCGFDHIDINTPMLKCDSVS